MTKEEYIERCRAHGEDRRSAENTWELGQKIERILKDEDLDPWKAPEIQYSQKIRLARLFIEEYKTHTLEGDKVIVRWCREVLHDGDLAALFESGEHWKWWHTAPRQS